MSFVIQQHRPTATGKKPISGINILTIGVQTEHVNLLVEQKNTLTF